MELEQKNYLHVAYSIALAVFICKNILFLSSSNNNYHDLHLIYPIIYPFTSLSKLGLGKPLDYTGTGMLKLTMLTDHPLIPHFEADFRTFTEGLLVEKMDGADCLPLLLSIGQHVERVWTVDTVESMQQASTLLSSMFLKEKHLPDLEVPDGLLVIFRLKATDSHHVDEFNPLQRCLPLIGSTPATAAKHLALIIPSDSRAASAMTSACSQWRNAMRMYDVQEHRGGSDMVLPTGILRCSCTSYIRIALRH